MTRAWSGLWCLIAVGLLGRSVPQAAEPTWEIQGQVLSVGTEDPRIVELRLPNGPKLQVPLPAFSASSQAAILSGLDKTTKGTVVAESPLNVIEEAIAQCKTAEDAVRALKLCLAGDAAGVPPADAAAAIERWEARAKRGEVRLGKAWVEPAVAVAAAEDRDELLGKLATMVSLQNYRLVPDYLEKASRVDLNSGRADFVRGMLAAAGFRSRPDLNKAAKAFAEVVTREPDNGPAWNNLAVCAMYTRRFDDALAHFKQAATWLDDPQVVTANVAAAVGQGGLSPKQVEAFTALYEQLNPVAAGPGQAPPLQSGLTFLSPFGQPISGQPNPSDLFVAPVAAAERAGSGTVVAPGMVLVPASLMFPGGSVVIRSTAEPGVERPAEVVAVSQGLRLALLRCEGLVAEAMPLAAKISPVGSEIMAVSPATRPRGSGGPGKIVAVEVVPGGFVYTADEQVAVGVPLVDESGRGIGLTAATPLFPQPNPPRAFGTPIERIWPFLSDHLPDLEPSESAKDAKPWGEVIKETARCLVAVIARPGP